MDSGDDPAAVEAEAVALIAEAGTPRRRVRPRIAAALRDAQDLEVATDEGSVAAWRLGEGPATLLVHGWEDDNALWGPFIETFVLYGRAVVVLDLPGHGFSEARLIGPRAVAAVLKALARTSGPIANAAAHSFGCLCLIAALEAGLSIERAALIAPPLPPPGQRRLERRIGALEPSPIRDRALELLRATPSPEPDFEVLEAVAGLRTQALFLHSLDDAVCPPENSARLSAAWPGAEVRYLDGHGHRGLVQDPTAVEAVFAFLEGAEAAFPGMI